MGFSNQERINLLTKALAAGVLDANSVSSWYETFFPFRFINEAGTVWMELGTLRGFPAANLSAAQTNAADPALSTILEDRSAAANAVRLTAVTGTNGSTWVAHSTYNDASSAVLTNWLLPQLVPQSSGVPSNGYAIRLYEGDPASGGTEISTTSGTTGTGDEKTVGWVWNYANGMLLLSDDFKGSVSDPYVVGFRYVGRTAQDTEDDLQTLEASVATTQGEVSTLQSEMATAQSNITTLQSEMTAAEADIDSLESDMTTAQSDITTLQSDVTTLRDDVDALQQSANGMVVRFVKGG